MSGSLFPFFFAIILWQGSLPFFHFFLVSVPFPGPSLHEMKCCRSFPLHHTHVELSPHDMLTKLAKSTALHDPAITLEAGSCKPSKTKLASILHTSLRLPQLCSLWKKERLPDCHMTPWRHDYTGELTKFLHRSRANVFIIVSQARLSHGWARAMLLLVGK